MASDQTPQGAEADVFDYRPILPADRLCALVSAMVAGPVTHATYRKVTDGHNPAWFLWSGTHVSLTERGLLVARALGCVRKEGVCECGLCEEGR